MAPGQCIVSQSDVGPFIDTGLTPSLIDPRVYVSCQAVIDMGALMGVPRPAELDAVLSENYRLRSENDSLRAQLQEADRYAEAAEYTLKATFGDDAKIKNKPGRKKAVAHGA